MPWHRFSTKLPTIFTAQQAVRIAGLDWRAIVQQALNGGERRALIREDSGETLAEVRSDYVSIQNLDAFGFFDPIVKAGVAVYDSIGTLENGRWVWMIARMTQLTEIAPGDPICFAILLSHRHGGSSVPTVACKPVRLVAKNTLHDGLLYPLFRTKITEEAIASLEYPPETVVEMIARHFSSVADKFRAVMKVAMTKDEVRGYLDAVFPKARIVGRSKYRDSADRDQAIDECGRLFVEGVGNNLPRVRGSLWAAYNAVAEYVDFCETRPEDPTRLQGIWGSSLKRAAMARATKLLP